MRAKSLDTRLQSELRSLNAGFLRLLTWPGYADASRRLGLSPDLAAQLGALSANELEFVAQTPTLLAGFELPSPTAVADQGPRAALIAADVAGCDVPSEFAPWSHAAHLFTATLLTWLWKIDSRDPLILALSVGPDQPLPTLGVSRIEMLATRASERLRVRFSDNPRFWTDMLVAARSGDPQLRELAHLAALPATLADGRTT